MKEGRKPEYPEKTPGDELPKIYTVIYIHIQLFTSSGGEDVLGGTNSRAA